MGRASSLALLLELLSGAFFRDATLALDSLRRADADSFAGEKIVRSAKPSQAGRRKASGAMPQ